MGYTTIFTGGFNLDKPLTAAHRRLIEGVTQARHQEECLPSHYCQWKVDETGTKIIWDGGEKFYGHIEWLGIIKLFLELLGYEMSGKIFWRGEERGDVGTIKIRNGLVKVWSAAANNEPESTPLPF